MSYLFKQEEIGDYRISIYQDEDADCPCKECDLLGVYIFGFGYCGNSSVSLHCNGDILFGKFDDGNHTLNEALIELICKYVPQNRLLSYLKKRKLGSIRMEYNRFLNIWEETEYGSGGSYLWSEQFEPKILKEYDCRAELTENMKKDDLVQIVQDLAKDIAFYDWISRGYCQGDEEEGFAYCDKERFIKRCDSNTKNWRKRALKIFESEIKDIGLWMWGDVKGYVLEKKVPYKKVYTEIGREPDDGYDWEQIDSCWGEYYDDEDELIKDVLEENGIKVNDVA